MSQKVNETIVKMINDLQAGTSRIENGDYQSTPLKRSISENSNDSNSVDEVPVKRIKQDVMNVSYIGSPREMRRMRAELVEARNVILCLENRISQMHNIRKEMQLVFESETQTLKRQQEIDRKSIEELEQQMQIVRKRESQFKNDVTSLKEKYEQLKSSSEEQILRLQRDISVIKEETQNSQLEDNIESSKLKRRVAELESVLKAAEEDAESQKKLASELSRQLAEKNAIERELDLKEVALQKAKNQIRFLENAQENYLEFQEQAKSQAQKLARYPELERENARLLEDINRIRDDIRNKILLEEEVHNLKTRLVKFKDVERELAELQAQNNQNQLHLNEWRAVARVICEAIDCDSALPHLLRTNVERLQQQELALTAEKVELDSQLQAATHSAKVARAELDKTQKLLKELKVTGEQKKMLIHRMQKKLMLVTRERDSYRLQLDSYERDLTIAGSGADIVQSQKERIDNLEKVLEGYRDMVTKLENDLLASQPNSDVVPVKQDQISRLQDTVDKLRAENDVLRQQKDSLEIRLENMLEGQDTLQGGQVVHLNQNPLAGALADRGVLVEQLQQEVVRLKTKLKKMEEGVETSKVGDISVCPKEVQALREQIKSNEKQSQRLKDYFKSSMQDFRNVIYMLFGFKIDKTSSSNIYKLRSMYAERAEHQLCFEVNPDGDLNLLENEYSSQLGPMIELHLIHQKSIPVFLSAITMDLFSQKTMTAMDLM
ncbi:mitotic spindle assembly checkpoint protein MAD1 [Cylas formicarius]|uniref:mitotic spindle assembly checkpoint protein MAD1 n=1 Tax=Cylas formicarius TaxID=197179 RepID=UPI002958BCD9|nr:mitotic spindle assembly checkpoint protein MAD1 [Cylas formicarius]